MPNWLRRLRTQHDPVTEQIPRVEDDATGPVEIQIGTYPDGRPMRIVLARSPRAQAALAAIRNFEPNAFDWASRFYVGDEVAHGQSFVEVWNELHPHRKTSVWDLDVVLAEADMVGVLAGQHRAEP